MLIQKFGSIICIFGSLFSLPSRFFMSNTESLFPSSNEVIDFTYLTEQGHKLKKEILTKGEHLVILFYRSACPYCCAYSGDFTILAKEYEERNVSFLAVRLSDEFSTRTAQKKEIAAQYGIEIQTFPCIALLQKKRVKEVIQGDPDQRSLVEMRKSIEKLLTSR